MRALWILAFLLLAGAAAWWLLAEPEQPAPQPAPAAADAVEPPAVRTPSVAFAPAELPDAGNELLADAGPGLIDVLVEVFGTEGHAPGAAISFHGPVVDEYAKYQAMRTPDADYGRAVGGGRTNVMGFTHALLPVGRWRVKPPAEPQYVDITPATAEVVVTLRMPNVVRGIVVDEKGAPVPRARVWVERDIPGAGLDGVGIDLPVGADGRFEYTTFDSSLTLATRTKGRQRFELTLRKHINVPCPEVKLYLGNLARVELDVKGIPDDAPLAVRYELAGIVSSEGFTGRALEVLPGHVTFRVRAVVESQRFAGGAEADVKGGETTRVPVEMLPVRGLEVHVVGEDREPVPRALVILNMFAEASSSHTDDLGVARFEPGVPAGRVARVEVPGRCVLPHSRVTLIDDSVTVTAVRCGARDSGVALDGGYDDRRDR